MKNISIMVKKILLLLTKQEQIKLLVLFLFVLLGVGLEAVGVGVIIPFISILSDPMAAADNRYIKAFIAFFSITSHQMLVVYACIGIIAILLLKNATLFLIYYTQTKFFFNKQAKLSAQLFWTYLTQPYIFFSERNSAEFQRNINSSVPEVVNGVIFPAMMLISECMVTIAIFLLLLWTDWFSSLSVLAVLGITAGLYYTWASKKIAEYTRVRNANSATMIKWVNQGVGGIKELKILGRENYFYDKFIATAESQSDVSCRFQIITFLPKLFFESVTVIALIVIVLMISIRAGDPRSLIPVLGLFAMAAFRILPAANRIATLNNSIQFYLAQLNTVYSEMINLKSEKVNFKKEEDCRLAFIEKIGINRLSFRYPALPCEVIKSATLEINKGETIGFVGTSGAGKSTLIDLILGLLKPTSGSIKIDGVDIYDHIIEWHKLIGYIPQTIYLIDDTILRNVALGVRDEEIDEARVWKVLEIAQLKSDIEMLPEKLDTVIGEEGNRLSGGQRQRIGIARALYHDPEILILDEATANLDIVTEKKFSQAIQSLAGTKTLLIVAHRPTTLEKCDKVYEVKQGTLVQVKGY